jgi:hypothetical protein
MSGVLKIRDASGNFVPINAIRGASAYEQAVSGGFKGSEEDFIRILNGYLGGVEARHLADTNNPHNVTAEQVGAVPEVYEYSEDLNNELMQGGDKMTICAYTSSTRNSPYSEGTSNYSQGMVITNAYSGQCATQICIPAGEPHIYIRNLGNGSAGKWVELYSELESKIALLESNVEYIAKMTGVEL